VPGNLQTVNVVCHLSLPSMGQQFSAKLQKNQTGPAPWLKPIIQATWEAEIGRIEV
jgi:hypothetical protein